MAQQINLLNPELRPTAEVLTAGLMAKVVVVFVLLLGAYGWSVAHETGKLSQQREEWVRRVQEEQARLVLLTQQNPARVPSQALQEEIKATAERVREREQVFDVLKSGAVGSGNGFSGLLQGFARQSVNGVWLTGISANGKGDRMRISGQALAPELIPQYINRLSGEQALRGHTFTAFEASQPKPQPAAKDTSTAQAAPAYIEFVLSAEKSAADSAAKPAAPVPPGAKP